MRFDIFALCVLQTVVLLSPEVRASSKAEQHPSLTKLLNIIKSDKCTGLMYDHWTDAELDEVSEAAQEQCEDLYDLLMDSPEKYRKKCLDADNPQCADMGVRSYFLQKKGTTRWWRCAVTLPDGSQMSIYDCVHDAFKKHEARQQKISLEYKAKKEAMRKNSGLSLPGKDYDDFEIDPVPMHKLPNSLTPHHAKMKKSGKSMFNWGSNKSNNKKSRRVAATPQTPDMTDTPSPAGQFRPAGAHPFGLQSSSAFGFPVNHHYGVGGNTPVMGAGMGGGKYGRSPSSVTMGPPPGATADVLRMAAKRLGG